MEMIVRLGFLWTENVYIQYGESEGLEDIRIYTVDCWFWNSQVPSKPPGREVVAANVSSLITNTEATFWKWRRLVGTSRTRYSDSLSHVTCRIIRLKYYNGTRNMVSPPPSRALPDIVWVDFPIGGRQPRFVVGVGTIGTNDFVRRFAGTKSAILRSFIYTFSTHNTGLCFHLNKKNNASQFEI